MSPSQIVPNIAQLVTISGINFNRARVRISFFDSNGAFVTQIVPTIIAGGSTFVASTTLALSFTAPILSSGTAAFLIEGPKGHGCEPTVASAAILVT